MKILEDHSMPCDLSVRIRTASRGRLPALVVAASLAWPLVVDSAQVVYLAEDAIGVTELYIVDTNSPGNATKLNEEASFSNGVWPFEISPDGTLAVYAGDQDTPNNTDLYLVEIENPGVSQRLGSLTDTLEQRGVFSPDGTKIAYTASPPDFSGPNLYFVDLASPDQTTQLNSTLPEGGKVDRARFGFTPDNLSVVYLADQDTVFRQELYVVNLNNPGQPAKLSGALIINGNVDYLQPFLITPNGTGVVYRADQDTNGVPELYLVEFTSPGNTTKINPALVNNGQTWRFALTQAGTALIYGATIDSQGRELYLTELASPGMAEKLSAPLTGSEFEVWLIGPSPNDALVFYATRDQFGDVVDLHMVDPASPGQATIITQGFSGSITSNWHVLSPDGRYIAFTGEEANLGEGVYVIDSTSQNAPIRLSPPLTNKLPYAFPDWLRWSPDSSKVAYLAYDDVTGVVELYLSDVAIPGVSQRLNAPLPPGAWVNVPTDLQSFSFVPEIASGRFSDVPLDYWALSFIETLAASGITVGCGGGNYCPEDSVTRAQMAVFLERGMHGSDFSPPAASGNVFLDVGASDFAASFIEQFFLDGITSGCGGNNYCPGNAVTRAQMAVFLLRAKHGAGYTPPPAMGVFTDVPLESFAVAWIEQLASEGITSGCGGSNYCPDNPVTRAQMAVFLVRTFEL